MSSTIPSKTTSQPHLEIFTAPIEKSSCSEFTLFPLFPKEIRLKIWKYSLQRQRILKIYLDEISEQAMAQSGRAVASGDGAWTNKRQRYSVYAEGYQTLSKMFRVNSESREVALKFYRVQIPCSLPVGIERDYYWWNTTNAPGFLYFNPEYDFLHIHPIEDTLVDFLYDLKMVHDPRHVGLLNLAIERNRVDLDDAVQLSELEPTVREVFKETISQLHEVFFVFNPRVGRRVVGIISGLNTMDTFFNRSFPVAARAPSFERLRRDPRTIGTDLKRVYLSSGDARMIPYLWFEILKKWGVSSTSTEYRLLVTFEPTIDVGVYDHGSAHEWLQKEDDTWTGFDREPKPLIPGKFPRPSWPLGGMHPDWKNEDLEKAVKPAFGFWLFPIDVLGPIWKDGETDEEGFLPPALGDLMKAFWNVSGCWPELGLTALPE